jgi:hypothetical protein
MVPRLRRRVYQLRAETRELHETLRDQDAEIAASREAVAEVPTLRDDLRSLRRDLDGLRNRYRRQDSPSQSPPRRRRGDSPSRSPQRRGRDDSPSSRHRQESREPRHRHRGDSYEPRHLPLSFPAPTKRSSSRIGGGRSPSSWIANPPGRSAMPSARYPGSGPVWKQKPRRGTGTGKSRQKGRSLRWNIPGIVSRMILENGSPTYGKTCEHGENCER